MVTSISVTSSVDVSAGDQTITATIQITDNDSGVDYGNIFLYRGDGEFVSSHLFDAGVRTSGDEFDGTYEVQATVPQYAPAGSWEVRMFAQDAEGNERSYGTGNESYPVPANAFFSVVNTGTVDTTPPAVVSVSVAPSSIDTGSVAQDVVITVNITDDLAGFRSSNFSFQDSASNYDYSISGFAFHTSVVSGDDLDGDYVITSSIPQGSTDGTWTFDVSVRDKVGNRATISAPTGASFVVNNTAVGGIGELSDATDATQYTWTTNGGADWFPQTAETVDGVDAAQSGAIGDGGTSDMEVTVTGPGTLDFMWKVDSEGFGDYLSVEVLGGGGDYEEITGDVDWESSSVDIPSGSQTVRFRYEKDGGGSDGADAGWVDQVCFSGDADTTEPYIQRISLSPNPVDISSGYVEVTITVEVSDDYNGFSDGYIYLIEDVSDYEYTSVYFDSSDLISGDSKFGTYEMTVDFYQEDFEPEGEEGGGGYAEGTYRIYAEVSEQSTYNTRYYGNGDDPFPIPSAEFFTVGGAPTGSGPILTEITSITPNSVDISAGDQSVTAVFNIVDNNIGFGYGDISVFNDSGNYIQGVSFDSADLMAGDEFNGTYSVSIPIYEHSEPGTWSLYFYLSDFAGNSNDYPFEVGFPNPGDEEFAVTNSGTVDVTDPVLTAFSVTPSTVDTSGGAQTVDVNFSLTDDLAGLGRITLTVYDPNGDYVSGSFTEFDGAGSLNGSYMDTVNLPMNSLEGPWSCLLSVRDRAGNSFYYVPASLGFTFGDPYPNPFSGQFTVGPVSGTTFGVFASGFGLTGLDALPGANPDNDAYNNAMELLLGLNPTVANPPNPTLYEAVRVGNEMQINFTIDPSLTVTTSGNYLEVSDGGKTPVMVTGQTGVNLIDDWGNQLPSNTSGTTYRVTMPIATPGSEYMRLLFMAP